MYDNSRPVSRAQQADNPVGHPPDAGPLTEMPSASLLHQPAPQAPTHKPPIGSWIVRNKLSSALIAVIVIALAIFGVTRLGVSTVTVHGTLEVDDFQGDCLTDPGFSDIAAGTQVVATNSDGSVIGTSSLGFSASQSAEQSSLQPGLSVCIYPFTVSGIKGGQSRYGITVSHRGTVWFSPSQIAKPVGLNLSSGGTGGF